MFRSSCTTLALAAIATVAACTKPANQTSTATKPQAPAATPADTPAAKPDTTPPANTGERQLTPRGFGPIRFGMSVAEAYSALHEHLAAGSADASVSCGYIKPDAVPAHVRLMVDSGEIVRADIDSTGVANVDGFGVGSLERDVVAKYRPQFRVQPHKYTPGWHYLIYLAPADTMSGYVFETDGSKVRALRAGRQPELLWVEGCS